ncbi:TPA: hypothetical protein U1366_000055 [Streptococcus suis]|nr:hypothetical protein [Streptococcus suis]HEM5299413.1 hypothetical protein [Streptococcus suis]
MIIAFEGLFGCGKSTQIEKLMIEFGDVLHFYKWNGCQESKNLFKELRNNNLLITDKAFELQQLFSCYLNFDILKKSEDVIIIDRYTDSGIVRDLSRGNQHSLNCQLYQFSKKADFIIFIDTPPLICYERLKNRRVGDLNDRLWKLGMNQEYDSKKFDKEGYLNHLKKLREVYLSLYKDRSNVYILDGTLSIESLYKIIYEIVKDKV